MTTANEGSHTDVKAQVPGTSFPELARIMPPAPTEDARGAVLAYRRGTHQGDWRLKPSADTWKGVPYPLPG